MARDIQISIGSYTCESCGHRWTHPTIWLRTDANSFQTISWPEEYNGALANGDKLTCISNSHYHYPICAQCTPLFLNQGWTTYHERTRGRDKHATSPARATDKVSDSALSALLGGKPRSSSDNT